eukprot:gene9922-biopygen6820
MDPCGVPDATPFGADTREPTLVAMLLSARKSIKKRAYVVSRVQARNCSATLSRRTWQNASVKSSAATSVRSCFCSCFFLATVMWDS